jgi:hypothetical protein
MPRPQVEVRGGKRLRATLRAAGDDLSDLRAAHGQVAVLVAGLASPPRRSGRLASTVRPSGTKTAAIVRAGFAAVLYAGPIHWGWPARNITAQPFLSDAATSSEPIWLPIYFADLERIIDKVEGL